MSSGSDRVEILEPSIMLCSINIEETNEVLIRRYISAMYMALFNYWCAIEYSKGRNHKRGRSYQDDDIQMGEFKKCMLGKGVDREIETLSIYRVACDHRVKNPAAGLKFSEGVNRDFHINNNSLKKVYNSFKTLLNCIIP